MTNERNEAAAEPCLMVRTEDGTAYAIPQSVVETHRLSDEQRAALEARATADDGDVDGFYYGPSGNVGSFSPTKPGMVVDRVWWTITYYKPGMVPWSPIDYHPPLR